MDRLAEIEQIRKQVEKHKAEADRAEGAIIQLMYQLKKEFGCESIEDAKKQLILLRRKGRRLGRQLDGKIEAFKSWTRRNTDEDD